MTTCPNCGAALAGRYCAACGQDQAADRTVRAMLSDLAGDLVGADSRLWRTLRMLFTRPGLLSVEHREGRRARYVPPTRLYLIASVVFFSAVALAPVQLVRIGSDAPETGGVRVGSGVRIDADTIAGDEEPTGMAAVLARAQEDPDRVNDIFVRSLAWVMFLLIPLFAAYLNVLFRDAGILYVQHLVFALHYHTFAFLTQALAYGGMHVAPDSEDAQAALILVANVANAACLYLALRRFYGTGRLRTFGRMAALGLGYLFTIVIAMIATVVFAMLLL